MMVWCWKYKTTVVAILLFFLLHANANAQQDSIRIAINDSTVFYHKIVWIRTDTSSGKRVAVYQSDRSRMAIVEEYKNGMAHGSFTYYFPNGKLMENTEWKEGKKSGNYMRMNIDATILISGKYCAGNKCGNWNDKSLKISGRYNKEGKKEGSWKWFNSEYSFEEFRFKNGILQSGNKTEPPAFLLHY